MGRKMTTYNLTLLRHTIVFLHNGAAHFDPVQARPTLRMFEGKRRALFE